MKSLNKEPFVFSAATAAAARGPAAGAAAPTPSSEYKYFRIEHLHDLTLRKFTSV